MTPGTRLGPYEILAPIGAGGMGEVYRARDTKLDRDVAIKVLPTALAQDPERLARFEREAKVLASLNHPNIAQIYGVEDRALIMELVAGETLQGPLPLETALNYTRQIGDALEAAHDKGIIHRDLKPANIMITPAGVVKVLDFGLAAVGQSSDPSNPANSPTLTISPTRAGMILGTAGYMSPEQARGTAVDKRADIWAFGVVLFEMLTGKRLFEGETVSDTLAQVLTKEPDWEQVPTKVRRLLRKCLEKDPKKRLRDIGDAWELLEDAPIAAAPLAPNGASRSRLGRTGWVAAAVLVVALGVALWAPWRAQKPADRPLTQLDVDLGADVSLPVSGAASSVAISPDGTRLVYASGSPPKLFTRRLDQPKPTELPGTEGAAAPFFSPDGQWVGFVTRGKLNKISVEGGAVVPLADINDYSGASWDQDGSILLGEGPGRDLVRIPSGGGTPETVEGLGKGEIALAYPQLLPGGKAVLFVADTTLDEDKLTIEVLTLADHRRKIVARGGASPRYLATSGGAGHLVYVNKATLFAIPFDLDKLETRGTAVPVLDDVAYLSQLGTGQFDFSRTGTMVYRRSSGGASAMMATLHWVDPTGKKEALLAKPGVYADPSLSPDGKHVVLMIGEGGSSDVWVYDLQRDAMTRLTFGGGEYLYPIWSPDGQYVVFGRVRSDGIFQARADGARPPQSLTYSKSTQAPSGFTPDGKRLAYMDIDGGKTQIWTVSLEDQGGQLKAGKPEQFLKSSFSDAGPKVSPDGRWLAYASNESGKYEVYVRAFPPPASGQGGKWQISNSGVDAPPRWSRNGHDLMYQSGDQIMAVSYTAKSGTFLPDKPRVWIAKLGGTAWDLAPDGKRVMVVTPVVSAEAPKQEHEVVFLENFFDELRRRVPASK
jgi:Tol biopolymer transport system component/predicted Ser/Thr protein kinase